MTEILDETGVACKVHVLVMNTEEQGCLIDMLQAHVDLFQPETDDEENALDVAKVLLYRLRPP